MSETDQHETFKQTAERWMQSDPMFSQPPPPPSGPPRSLPTTYRSGARTGDVSILSGGLALFAAVACLTLTVSDWAIPFFGGTLAVSVAVFGIITNRAGKKGWVATGLIVGALTMGLAFLAKMDWDEAHCKLDADTLAEAEACDG